MLFCSLTQGSLCPHVLCDFSLWANILWNSVGILRGLSGENLFAFARGLGAANLGPLGPFWLSLWFRFVLNMKEIWIQAPNLLEISHVVKNSQRRLLDHVPNAMTNIWFEFHYSPLIDICASFNYIHWAYNSLRLPNKCLGFWSYSSTSVNLRLPVLPPSGH